MRAFDFAMVLETRAKTSADLVAERDNVVIRPEQRREDRRIGTVVSVAVILRPDIHRGLTVVFQDTTDVLVIFNTTQNFHTLRRDGIIFLRKLHFPWNYISVKEQYNKFV